MVVLLMNNVLEGMWKEPKGKRPPRRARNRCEDNIKMYLTEIRWGDLDWIDLAQDRDHWNAIVNTVMNLRIP
jgi:hypothetical protein